MEAGHVTELSSLFWLSFEGNSGVGVQLPGNRFGVGWTVLGSAGGCVLSVADVDSSFDCPPIEEKCLSQGTLGVRRQAVSACRRFFAPTAIRSPSARPFSARNRGSTRDPDRIRQISVIEGYRLLQ